MVEHDANSIGFALLDWNDRLQKYYESSPSNEVAIYVPDLRHRRSLSLLDIRA